VCACNASFVLHGNVEVLIKMHSLGYSLVQSGPHVNEEEPPVASMLVRFGHLAAAKRLVEVYPEFGLLQDAFGVSANDLIRSHDLGPRGIPNALLGASHLPKTPDDSVVAPYGTGGWPTHEIPFPGWAESVGCQFAELSGEEVAKDHEVFVREFVLKHRPVMLRDFIRHDEGLFALMGNMAARSVLQDLGYTSWDAGKIPYESTYTGQAALVREFPEFIQSVVQSQSAEQGKVGPQDYIFASSLNRNAASGTSINEEVGNLFPEVPTFINDGIDLASFPTKNSQFYVGPAGSGAPLHYHNAAFNALAYGKKGWVLVPPANASFSNKPAADMAQALAGDGPKGVLRCVQNAGDVLVVPPSWGHLTLNLAASIGVAKEFDVRIHPNGMKPQRMYLNGSLVPRGGAPVEGAAPAPPTTKIERGDKPGNRKRASIAQAHLQEF